MNNAAAIGYALMVLKKEWHFSPENLREFESAMRRVMDMHSEKEAEEVYQNN